jgi:hypothetical protein
MPCPAHEASESTGPSRTETRLHRRAPCVRIGGFRADGVRWKFDRRRRRVPVGRCLDTRGHCGDPDRPLILHPSRPVVRDCRSVLRPPSRRQRTGPPLSCPRHRRERMREPDGGAFPGGRRASRSRGHRGDRVRDPPCAGRGFLRPRRQGMWRLVLRAREQRGSLLFEGRPCVFGLVSAAQSERRGRPDRVSCWRALRRARVRVEVSLGHAFVAPPSARLALRHAGEAPRIAQLALGSHTDMTPGHADRWAPRPKPPPSLAAAQPPPLAAPPALPPIPAAVLVESVVCSAADAMALAPQAVRPALLAAFARASEARLAPEAVVAVLSPKPPAGKAKAET